MRILHAIAIMAQGGAERLVLELSSDAVAKGDDVAVASFPGPWAPLVGETGARLYSLPRDRRSPRGAIFAIARLTAAIRDFEPDLIHTHNVGVTAFTRVASRIARSNARLVTTFHGVPPEDYGRAARILRYTAPEVVACSDAVGRSLVSAGYPEGRLSVVPNAARFEPPSADRVAAMRARFGLGERPLVLGVGRLVAQKSWETLIEASTRLRDVDVLVAGEGELLSDLERRVAASGGRVRFVGFVDDVAALVACADCVVSTSRWEGLPLTLLEALSLGVPVICTAVDGVVDVVSEEAAFLVPLGDADAVAASVVDVLASPEQARRRAETGRALIEARSPAAMSAGYRELYSIDGKVTTTAA